MFTEAHLQPSRTSTMDHFLKIVNGLQPLTVLAKRLLHTFLNGF